MIRTMETAVGIFNRISLRTSYGHLKMRDHADALYDISINYSVQMGKKM